MTAIAEHEHQQLRLCTVGESLFPGGAMKSPEEPGARRNHEEPGGARESQEEPGGARRSQEEPGG